MGRERWEAEKEGENEGNMRERERGMEECGVNEGRWRRRERVREESGQNTKNRNRQKNKVRKRTRDKMELFENGFVGEKEGQLN